jgi:hypothetical protein
MNKTIKFTLDVDCWVGDTTNKLILEVPFSKIVHIVVEELQKLGQDNSNPIRQYVSAAYCVLNLLLNVLSQDTPQKSSDEPVVQKSPEEPVVVKKVRRKRMINPNRKPKPSAATLTQLINDGASQSEIANLYGFGRSAISRWLKVIKEGGRH